MGVINSPDQFIRFIYIGILNQCTFGYKLLLYLILSLLLSGHEGLGLAELAVEKPG